jgi:histidine ammonia-lyase
MIAVGKKRMSIADFEKVVLQGASVSLSSQSLSEVKKSYDFLKVFSKDKLIYGINTGFGPMAQYRIDEADLHQLQYNLVRSHSSGTGKLLTPAQTRALMLARLNTMLLGYSGIHQDTVKLLETLINNEAYPCVYAHGGVGASGDLVQLAHLALGMIGEGDFYYKGKITTAKNVYKSLNAEPLKIHIREGLSILNGTSAMTGIGGINVVMARRLVQWSLLLSLVINEMMEAYSDSFSAELNDVKQHNGQTQIAAWMRTMGKGSKLLRRRDEHLYDKKITEHVIDDKVQEYYSLRCVPQILGPILDTVLQAQQVIENELNSVNDNPVVDHKNNNIFHGGNFHGDYIALEMDKLKLVVTKLSMLAERQLNFLLNPHLNQKLPPFTNAGRLGLNFGMQGMQYPATSTVAENQALSTSLYIHSIPNNNDNQDVVSMGCNAAMMCSQVIENAHEVLAVELVTLMQAVDIREISSKLSPAGKWLYAQTRKIFPYFKEDFAPSQKLQEVKSWLMNTDVAEHFSKELNTRKANAK